MCLWNQTHGFYTINKNEMPVCQRLIVFLSRLIYNVYEIPIDAFFKRHALLTQSQLQTHLGAVIAMYRKIIYLYTHVGPTTIYY